MNYSLKIFITLIVLMILTQGVQAQTVEWKIKKTEWSAADEKAYSEFVALMGKAVEKRECNSFQSCLKHPNNPYRGSDTDKLNIFADCAKLSYVFRGYFAWKNALPFSVADDLELRPVPGNDGDKRYSKYGNQVTSRLDFLPKKSGSQWRFVDAIKALNRTIPGSVYSANFRFHYENSDDEKLFTDFYPVDVTRESIVPGTNIYDPNGHVAIVYKVTDDGKIYFIDAHPDNSLTSGLFGTKFVRSNPGQGAGFKNFRPIKLVDAQFDSAQNSYVGGKIVPHKNADLTDFDLVQFFGTDRVPRTDWSKGPFVHEGVKYNYYDYIRLKLSKGNLKLDPMNEIRSLASDLCQTTQDRVDAVDAAVRSGVHLKPHPARLPYNIYGTSGEWEEFSTPSRDARLKTSFVELRKLAEDLLNMYLQHDPRLVYNGTDIKADMLASYQQVSTQCQIVYKKTNSEHVSLNLDQVRERLFDLSFDPYHCVELRWGARSAQELASCPDGANKRAWYSQERWLRNQIERRYDARMDYSLEELTGPLPGAGVAESPDVDIVSFLRR